MLWDFPENPRLFKEFYYNLVTHFSHFINWSHHHSEHSNELYGDGLKNCKTFEGIRVPYLSWCTVQWGDKSLVASFCSHTNAPIFNHYFSQFLRNFCIIAFLYSPDHAYQISTWKKQNSIFGEFLKSIFMVLHSILLKTINGEFFKFNCGDM